MANFYNLGSVENNEKVKEVVKEKEDESMKISNS